VVSSIETEGVMDGDDETLIVNCVECDNITHCYVTK